MPKTYMTRADYAKGWASGHGETPCGKGSQWADTGVQRKWIPEMVAKYNIQSIADLGAGDLNWIKRIELGCEYKGYDLIVRNDSITELNLLTDDLPQAQCLMVLWVLNHFSPEDQRIAMTRVMDSGAKYLIITYDKRLEPILDQPFIEMAVLRHDRGIDSEIRLIELCRDKVI